MLHLHVWGPALGLPSIDAECLAIITYLRSAALPSTEWNLVPSNDPSVSPSHLLPALHHNGVWTSGFQPIVDYLMSHRLTRNLDESLSAAQRADSVAVSAYLAARAGPLVDLSLYVSAANWSGVTRPAYSTLLTFPLTWTAVPLIRAEAVKRAEHLGLAELDRDFDPNGGLHLTAGRDALPETFRRHLPAQSIKKTLSEEMTPEQATAIRLYSVTEACIATLEGFMAADTTSGEKTQGKPRFSSSSDAITSVDCLAFGYLALMRQPNLPRPFLHDCIEKVSPRLCRFVDDMSANHLVAAGLPWSTHEQPGLGRSLGRTIDSTLRHVPTLGDYYTKEVRRRADENITSLLDATNLVALGSLLATSAALGYTYYYYKSVVPFGRRLQTWTSPYRTSRFAGMGQAQSLFSSVLGGGAVQQGYSNYGNASAGSRIVDSNLDLD
jgi:sorting and assembly machinery component 37